MIISQYIVGFVIFSFFGWVWESFYCMMNTGKWENRGFLFGPYCPIYGLAVMIAYFIFTAGLFPVTTSSSPLTVFLICLVQPLLNILLAISLRKNIMPDGGIIPSCLLILKDVLLCQYRLPLV